jgi:filamentous hemagglutinin family protein
MTSSTSLRLALLLWVSGVTTVGVLPAYGLPRGGSVVSGEASIETVNPNQLDIHQASDQAILHWESFSITPDGQVNFHQPSATSSTLNRVTGSTPSDIAGRITAQGTVILVNPNGILLTPTAQVDVGSLVLSTLDIQDQDFLEGRYRFEASVGDVPAGLENHGNITVSEGGLAAFIAPHIVNRGVIAARLGTVAMASGQGVTLDFVGNGFLQIQVDPLLAEKLRDIYGNPLSALISQSGDILAEGGQVILSAAMVEQLTNTILGMDGVIQGNRVENQDGRIVLRGDGPGGVNIAGQVEVDGGQLEVSARELTIESEIGTPQGSGTGTADMDVALELGHETEAGRLTIREEGFLRVRELAIRSPYQEPDEASVVIDNARADGLHGETLSLNTGLALENFGFNPSSRVNVNAGGSIQQGINAVTSGGFVAVAPGLFREGRTIAVNQSVTIAGAGDGTNPANSTIISGENAYAVFDVTGNSRVRFDGLRIQAGAAGLGGGGMRIGNAAGGQITNSVFQGNSAGEGGAIENFGNLTLQNVLLSNNRAFVGGGIANHGNLTIRNSRISANTASFSGGGIANITGGTATIINTNISNNTASGISDNNVSIGEGGGIANRGNLTLERSTVSGNTARISGGGLANVPNPPNNRDQFNSTILNSTISSNVADYGGGIANARTLRIINSTIANNQANQCCGGIVNVARQPSVADEADISLTNVLVTGNSAPQGNADEIGNVGTLRFLGGNLIGASGNPGLVQSVQGLGFNPGITIGSFITAAVPTNQIITGLGNFGGVTQTHNLVAGSPAINAGVDSRNLGAATDQRGAPRPVGGAFDIGAVEFGSTPPPIPQPPAAPTPPPPPPSPDTPSDTPPTSDDETPQNPGNSPGPTDPVPPNLDPQPIPSPPRRQPPLRDWKNWQGIGRPDRNTDRYQEVTHDGDTFSVGIAPYDVSGGSVNLLERPIEPSRQTTFYTHGWNNDHNSPGARDFAQNMLNARGPNGAVDQAVMVDWGAGAKTGDGFLKELGLAAARIPSVAEALALRILESGLRPEEVDLVGHSLGAYVSVEAAVILWRRYGFAVNSLTLLDPANVASADPRYTPPPLADLSQTTSTLSIYHTTRRIDPLPDPVGNPTNNEVYARTAKRSIALSSIARPSDGHGYPVTFYGRLLAGSEAGAINNVRQEGKPFNEVFGGNAGFRPWDSDLNHVFVRWP